MSELSKKYQIPAETIKRMIDDGVISSSWPNYEDVYRMFKEGKSATEISDFTHMSTRNVYNVINKFK